MNLDEISVLILSTTARALKPVQEYGQLKTVTMEMKELYIRSYILTKLILDMLRCPMASGCTDPLL